MENTDVLIGTFGNVHIDKAGNGPDTWLGLSDRGTRVRLVHANGTPCRKVYEELGLVRESDEDEDVLARFESCARMEGDTVVVNMMRFYGTVADESVYATSDYADTMYTLEVESPKERAGWRGRRLHS
jgi:hypothetical protein